MKVKSDAVAESNFLPPPSPSHSDSLWQFVRALGRHWITLMGGGAITVALGVFERLSGRNVPLWIYVVIILSFIFWACYLAWRDRKRSETGLSTRVAELEERARPKLEILYNDGRFNHDEYLNGEIIGRIIRFAVRNDSDAVVNGVRIEAHGFINATGTRLPPMPLEVTNDQGHVKANGFSLNPHAIERIDLMKKHHDSQEMYLATTVQGVNVSSQQERMTLGISVSGETSPNRETTFRVWVNNKGLLECD